ncbi:hypothetical protein MTR_3g032177 [Medicago truncatula]|uniref:Uncharacterized protein n=1 Tax=Medicago truncatula TaxID=3880 RepID=A0A072V4X0_MEDTR|nr:hypothetical protein MTR_3g032177 [Medicago truncatula]
MIGSKSYVNAIKELRLERILACAYNLSRGTEQTPRQNAKSNAAQDDEQHNAALRRRNHKNTKGKT